MASQRQKLAAQKLVENGGNKGKVLQEVGYSKNTAKTPTKVLESKGFIEETQSILRRVENQIAKAQKRADELVGKAGFSDVSMHQDRLMKQRDALLGNAPKSNDLNINILNLNRLTDDELANIITTSSKDRTSEEGISEEKT